MVMTTFRVGHRHGLTAILLALASSVVAFAAPATPGGTVPTAWTWAYAEFEVDTSGPADTPWRTALPQLLVKEWDHLPSHAISDAERQAWLAVDQETRRRELARQRDQKALDLSRLVLQPVLPTGEPAASEKALAALDAQLAGLDAAPPGGLADSLPFQLIAPSSRPGLPSAASAPAALERESHAFFLVTGTLKLVAGYLNVTVSLTSTLEHRVLAHWNAVFAPDEAPEQMLLARRALQEALLGRPWAAVDFRDELEGTVVSLEGEGRKTLPWIGEFLVPGDHKMTVFRPGLPPEERVVTLTAGQTNTLSLASDTTAAARQMLRLTSEPPGATVTADSRALGITPLELPRPLAVTRVKLRLDGYAPQVIEVQPTTVENLNVVLLPPQLPPDTVAARDRFYVTVTALTASLAATVFLKDAADQAYRLATAYSSGTQAGNFTAAVGQYQLFWYTSQAGLALTTGVFVWMMFSLGDFLAAAQTPLP